MFIGGRYQQAVRQEAYAGSFAAQFNPADCSAFYIFAGDVQVLR